MTDLEMFKMLCLPKDKWHKETPVIIGQPALLPIIKDTSAINVESNDSLDRIKLVHDWLNKDDSTKMSITEFKDFWSGCRLEDKIYLGMMASEELGIKIKDN